jgi:hypothetical protein
MAEEVTHLDRDRQFVGQVIDGGSIGEEDGFTLGRDGVNAVPGVCLDCPLCQWGVLPRISCELWILWATSGFW